MIVFCFDSWQAKDFLKKIITNIYNSFIFTKFLMSYRDHFVSFCRFIIYHSICILWLDSDNLIAKYLDSFHSNRNFPKPSLYTDCYENEIIYHRKRHRNLLQSHILAFISRSEMLFFRNAKKNNATNIVFNKISKNIKIN